VQDAESLPQTFATYAEPGEPRQDRWWTRFGDPQMDSLVERALQSNLTLQQAESRLRQAYAVATQKGAALAPELSLEGAASATRQRTGEKSATVENYGLGLAVSYELDLWGRVRSARNAARLEARASRSDRDTAAMTVAAEVVLNYLQWLGQQETLALLQQQVLDNHDRLDLLGVRYGNAQASALDVFQQQEVLAAAEALVPAALAGETQRRHALAVLLGLPPPSDLQLHTTPLPGMPPLPDTGVPLDLLTRRPDVEAARSRLQQAAWQVGAARADRLPSLRLSASAAYSSDDLADLFDDWLARLAASLTGPLLDAGRRRAEVTRTRAVVDERLAAYRAILLNAVRDVQDALMLEFRQGQTVEALQRQADAAARTQSESLGRYLNGQVSYLTVVSAGLNVQKLKRDLIQAHYQRLSYRVQLYRALGGDWSAILQDRPDVNTVKE
jgi:NodT family efflux transporter outer membrane factor (OMF) lipoprotein